MKPYDKLKKEIKIGDKVKRVRRFYAGMTPGDTAIVKDLKDIGNAPNALILNKPFKFITQYSNQKFICGHQASNFVVVPLTYDFEF